MNRQILAILQGIHKAPQVLDYPQVKYPPFYPLGNDDCIGITRQHIER